MLKLRTYKVTQNFRYLDSKHRQKIKGLEFQEKKNDIHNIPYL